MLCISVVIEDESESPTDIIAITDAIPMIIPSIVRNARILFERKLSKANTIFSLKNILFHLGFYFKR